MPAGYYALKVMDADSTLAYADITLTEPTAMKIAAEPYKYPNGYNVSCYDCFNGSIDVTVHYGVPPYAYDWGDGVQTEDRSGLGAVKYGVKVTDANGCVIKSETVYMSQPERESWDMGGNASTDPDAHYMGTSDSTDLVLKSNGQERIRLKRNGDIAILGNEPATGLLMRAVVAFSTSCATPCPSHLVPWTSFTPRSGSRRATPSRSARNPMKRHGWGPGIVGRWT